MARLDKTSGQAAPAQVDGAGVSLDEPLLNCQAAAALLNEYKLPGAPQSVAQDRVAKEALRHPKELGLMQQEQGAREQGSEGAS